MLYVFDNQLIAQMPYARLCPIVSMATYVRLNYICCANSSQLGMVGCHFLLRIFSVR